MTTEQVFLVIAWRTGSKEDRSRRLSLNGQTVAHCGDCPVPDLSQPEMQQIAFAAKMELARVLRRRKRSRNG